MNQFYKGDTVFVHLPKVGVVTAVGEVTAVKDGEITIAVENGNFDMVITVDFDHHGNYNDKINSFSKLKGYVS